MARRWLISTVATGGVVLLGWGLMKVLVPSREEMLKKIPDAVQQLPETELRNTELLQAIKESAASKEPIWKVGTAPASPKASDPTR